MRKLGVEIYVLSAGVILLVASLIRVMIAAGDSQVLALSDPLIGIPIRYAVLGVGAIELAAGLYCLFGKSVGTRLALLAWLMTNWAVYRIGSTYLGSNLQCSCLGSFIDPLQLPRELARFVTVAFPIYLITGTSVGIVLVWLRRRRQRKQSYLKVVCPGCRGHIAFPPDGLRWKIACPHCGGGVRLQNLPQIG